jgi:hypothetical protein
VEEEDGRKWRRERIEKWRRDKVEVVETGIFLLLKFSMKIYTGLRAALSHATSKLLSTHHLWHAAINLLTYWQRAETSTFYF